MRRFWSALFNRASETVRAVSQRMFVARANKWRDQYNPLRGLEMSRAVSLLEEGERGAYADLQWLYRLMEKRDETVGGMLGRFEGGLAEMTWQISIIKGKEDDPAAQAQKEYLEALYEGIDNLSAALVALMRARFRGFALLEKWYGPDGAITHLEDVPQWYWVRDGMNGPWEYNRDARSGTTRGEPIEPANFITREFPRPINELALEAFVGKKMGDKDWAGFVEVFGISPIFIVGPPGVTPEQEAEYQAVAEGVVSDARGYLPNGSDVKTLESGGRGTNPFKEFIDAQKEKVVLAGTGGKLTMLTASTGLGSSQGDAHEKAWRQVVRGEGKAIAEILQAQVDKVELSKRFHGQKVLAYFDLQAPGQEEQDIFRRDAWKTIASNPGAANVMANLVCVKELTSDVGLPVEDDYEVPELPVVGTADPVPSIGTSLGNPAEPPLPPKDPQGDAMGNRSAGASGPAVGSIDAVLAALAQDFAPVRERLARINEIEDPDIWKQKLTAFLDSLPGLTRDINADPEAARVMSQAMEQAISHPKERTMR